MNDETAAVAFERLRPRLTRLSYRMLGSLAEAEDIVQNAYLRWRDVDPTTVREPTAYLVRTVTRLCLDQKKSARARRETYIGPWLPEPLIEHPMQEALDADALTLTLMLALESLSPLERAAFLLHDIFDRSFDEVAEALGRDPAACRQLAARARTHIRAQRPRFKLERDRGAALAKAFFDASSTGDVAGLQALLASDAVVYSDGGGKAPATINPIFGLEKIARLYAGLAVKQAVEETSILLRLVWIDGLPGFVARDRWGILYTTALDIEDGRVVAIYTMRNPDKLDRVAALLDSVPPEDGVVPIQGSGTLH
ncbi:MAG TPA: sigma-70 family RNA polymerase sigma factor [Stellaceae bacterium]|jgi:RNA polymerase sigma-70 factor (ECF subfamily)|nr:sigma-70 family RNA polymerase sigma factor [Stellaceae bacterium]